MSKKYYAQRTGVKPEPLDFEMLKKAFELIFTLSHADVFRVSLLS